MFAPARDFPFLQRPFHTRISNDRFRPKDGKRSRVRTKAALHLGKAGIR
jgi:hypothetical protein